MKMKERNLKAADVLGKTTEPIFREFVASQERNRVKFLSRLPIRYSPKWLLDRVVEQTGLLPKVMLYDHVTDVITVRGDVA